MRHSYGQYRNFDCKADIDTVTKAIDTWADDNGYAIGDKLNWTLSTVPKGQKVGQVRLREAWKPSFFDRWQATWLSFRRISPRLSFELLASENPVETQVSICGITDYSTEQQSDGSYCQIPNDLLAIFEKLKSDGSAAGRRKDDEARKAYHTAGKQATPAGSATGPLK